MPEPVQAPPPDKKQRAKWREQFERDGPTVVRQKLNGGGYGVGYRAAEAKAYLRDEERSGVDRVTVAILISALSLIIAILALFK